MGIEPLERVRAREATDVLTRAFRDNPGVIGLTGEPDAGARHSMLHHGMTGFVGATLRAGRARILVDGGRVAGVSLSFGPGQYPLGILEQLRMAVGPLRARARLLPRYFAFDRYLQRHHLAGRHHYLWFLGVDPELQGRGLGSALLREFTGHADRDAVPCYLETDKESSVRLYRGHGFSVDHEETPAEFGFHMWHMTRPRSAGG